MPVLNGAVDLVQDSINAGSYNPELAGFGNRLAEVGKMTGEERALAGFWMVQNILGQNLGTKSAIYEAVSQADMAVFDKSMFAELTNLGGVRVGTNDERKRTVERVSIAVSDGPSDGSPIDETMVRYNEIYKTIDGVGEVKVKEKVHFVGGGEDPRSWRVKGGEVSSSFNEMTAVKNMILRNLPLDEKYRNTVRQLKIWLLK